MASLEFGARIGKLEAVAECKDENSKAVSNLNSIVATAKDNFDASREGMKAETAAANKETLAATKNAASAGDKETLAAAKLADSALKVELTEAIAKSTSPATAHIVACQKLQIKDLEGAGTQRKLDTALSKIKDLEDALVVSYDMGL